MILSLLALAALVCGFFLLLKISPADFADGLFKGLSEKPNTLKAQINVNTKRKKVSYIRREIADVKEILRVTGRSEKFSFLCVLSLALAAGGITVSVLLGNIFLAPVLAVGMLFVPFWYVRLTAVHYKKELSQELETALSVITNAYMRSEDFVKAIEENLAYLNPPVKQVFEDFVNRVRLINPDIINGIHEMRGKIENDVFKEWCDAMCSCQRDRSLKSTLTPIVTKLSDMRVVNAELEYMMNSPRKEFITMALMVVGNIPLMYCLNKEWYNTLMNTTVGHIVLAVSAVVIFISAAFVIRYTKPIEYRR